MLHIILAILKIIGILLAAILGLLLLAVLLVLFVPLRYRLEFERKEEKIWAKARFGWLARLILAEAVLIDGKPKVRVRLCGFSKQLIPAPEKKPEKKASRDAPKQQKGGARPQESKEVPKNKAVLKNKAEPEKEADPVKKAGPVKKEDPEKKTDPVKKTEGESGTVSKTVSDPGVQADAEKVLDAGTQAESHIRGFIEKIRVTVLRLWQIIREIPQIPSKLWKKWQGVQNKAEAVKRKILHYINLWKDEGTQAVFVLSKDQIRFLWRHLRPRKITGELKYGFDDPSITGMMTGVLYMILPMSCYEVKLLPEFEPERSLLLEGKLLIIGHVRLCHLAGSGWKFFRDKNLRKLIKQLKA